MLSAVKMAKYYELEEEDVVLTVFTDSMELYGSRLQEMHAEHGDYTELDAAADHGRWLRGERTDNLLELSYEARKRIHNLKYYTWVEQQGKSAEELNAQWYDPGYWTGVQGQVPEIDALIEEFNARVALN
jgi:hypothetical protein